MSAPTLSSVIRQSYGPSARIVHEVEPPAHALRDMPSLSSLPKDQVAREIVLLLHEHPEIAGEFDATRLSEKSAKDRADMLTRIKAALGIQPLRHRSLSYVGP